MLIQYLVFITISIVFCEELTFSQIHPVTCEGQDIYIYCTPIGSDLDYDLLKPCLDVDKVVHLKSCSPSVLPVLGSMLREWSTNFGVEDGFITLRASNLSWQSLNPHSFVDYTTAGKLIADHNELKTLPDQIFASAYNFNYLDVSYNRFEYIESIEEAGVAKLETLLISHNNIGVIGEKTFKNFNNLKILDLSFNNLTNIAAGAFDLVGNLKNLSIAYNSLSYLDFGIFSHLTSMESIDISNNGLHTVDFRVHLPIFRHLKHINMESNQINAAYGFDASTFPYLSHLSLRNNSFDCGNLQNILTTFDLKQLNLTIDPSKMVKAGYAFRGIACQPPQGVFAFQKRR